MTPANAVMTVAAPGATGKRHFRPESEPQAQYKPNTRPQRPARPPPGLKGRFQQSQVREHLVRMPPKIPPGLKGRFQQSQVRKHLVRMPPKIPPGLKGRSQQSQVRKHLETSCMNAKTTHALKSALQA